MPVIRELWRQRWLFRTFLQREFANRYAGTAGGLLWALVQPILMLAIYAFVFRTIFRVALPDLQGHSFVGFVACGLWPWMAFSEGLQRATQSITGNGGLIKKVRFSHELLVFASITATFLIHFTGFALALLLLTANGEPYQARALEWVVAGWLILFVITAAAALVTSALQVVIRDTEQLISPALMLLFYATPILYPVTMIPQAYRWVVAANPLADLFETMRLALLNGSPTVSWPGFGAAAMTSLLFLAVAWLLFRRLSSYFEDMV
jgi:ABC-type polysaccharide/polyol phosphate export permease